MPKISNVTKYRSFADRALQQSQSVGKDAFRNAPGRMGYQTPSVAEGAEYELVRWTNDYWLMVTLFRNHWIARKIVEIPAKDMVKAWPRLNCELKPEQISDFDRTIQRTLTPLRIKKAITWARLFGGAGALMVIKGHENILDKPLNLDDINPGSYKGLIVFDRWSGITPKGNQAQDIESPLTFGLPEYYTVHGQNGNEALFDVHASRILRFVGPDLPTPEHEANQYWGLAIPELIMEEMKKRDNASWSILQLLFRAQILTQVNPELAQLLSGAAASAGALQRYQQVMQAQNELLSNQSMLLLGKEGKLESHQYTFGGVADVLDRFEIALAACSIPSIPYSKLFGKNSSGLDNSNDADERNYEESIATAQNDDMKPQLMQQLYPVICMSEFGEVPDDLDIKFPSIRVLSEEDKSKLAKEGTEAILAPFNAGVTSQKLTGQELAQLSEKTEIFSNITPEIIAKMDDKPQVPIEVEQAEAKSGEAEFEEGNQGKDSNFEENEHPRDQSGKFSVTSGNSTESHFKKNGEYTQERQELHKQIVGKLLSGKSKSKNPSAYILGGGSASGKSTGFKRMLGEKFVNEVLTIDSDAIKEMIPEYEALKKANPEKAAALVHEESSHLAKQAMALATAKNIDFVYDSTGSGKGLPKVAERLKSEGYKVHAIYFDVPIDEARKRANSRAERTGRHIPESVLQETHRGSSNGFMNLKDNPNLESVKMFSNVDRIPALVYTRNGGDKGLVVDENAWKSYQKKAGK